MKTGTRRFLGWQYFFYLPSNPAPHLEPFGEFSCSASGFDRGQSAVALFLFHSVESSVLGAFAELTIKNRDICGKSLDFFPIGF